MSAHEPMNGKLSPSEKAWQTAKDRAVMDYEERQAANRIKGELEREEMIRALCDANLSHGAARLFCLLLKACWMKEFGGLYRERVGSVMIDGRRLARLCGGASVNCLYRKLRAEKRDPKTGQVLRHSSETLGWIEELVRGGYLWLSKHRIPNIPRAKWPNVYHVTCHVPQEHTPNLPWLDGGLGSENVINTTLAGGCSPWENRFFGASGTPGDGQMAENTTASHRMAHLPVTAAEDRQSPHGQLANHRSGGQAITAAEITGNHRSGGQAVTGTANGQGGNPVQLRESLDRKTLLKTKGGKESPPADALEVEFKRWEVRLDDMRNSDLRTLEATLKNQFQGARGESARALAMRKLAAVRLRLRGPQVESEAPATATASTAKISPPKGLKKATDAELAALAAKIGPEMRKAIAGGAR